MAFEHRRKVQFAWTGASWEIKDMARQVNRELSPVLQVTLVGDRVEHWTVEDAPMPYGDGFEDADAISDFWVEVFEVIEKLENGESVL